MWIRSAFWTGRARPGCEDAFAEAVNGELIPALRRLPAVEGAEALWPRRREDDPPAIACQILVHFNDEAGIGQMLASSERQAVRSRVREVMATLFDGTISHIDFQVG